MNQPTKPAPLGRGLSALFGDADRSYSPAPGPVPHPAERMAPHAPPAELKTGAQRMPLAWIQPAMLQPRRLFDEATLKELALSIRERGIIEPLLLRPVKGHKDSYEIIAGERRWRAAQMAGLHEVPVVVRETTDREALELAIIENVQRQDLSPLEEAEGYERLIGEFSHTVEAVGKIVGKSRSHIANLLRLISLPAEVKQMIDEGKLTMGHARALITTPDPVALAKEIVSKGLNVRQAEDLAKLGGAYNLPKGKKARGKSADTLMLEKEIERVIGLRVQIDNRGGNGKMVLYYKDLNQLDGIIKRLRG